MKPTKYIRRLPDGKGGWKYIYPKDMFVEKKHPQKGVFSSYPTTNNPGKLERKDFISSEDYLKQIRDKYLSPNAKSLKENIGLKIGQWKINHFPGANGNKIYQLREINFDNIEKSTAAVDKEDSDKYVSLIKNGITPPPIEVEETPDGKLKIIDGQKLAKEMVAYGMKIFAWVSPIIDASMVTGLKDKSTKTELTYQLARQIAQAEDSKRSVYENEILNHYLKKDISIEKLIGKKIVGYRYGKAPESGKSFNSMTNTYENGISIAKIGNMEEVKSFAVLGIKERGAKKYYYEGVIAGEGGDDEITMTDVREISYLDYQKKIKNKEIVENSNDIAAAFAQRKILLYNRGWNVSNPEEVKSWLLKNISKQSTTLEKARRDNPGIFTAYTPRQLRDAIEIEMKECNDIKKASDTAMRNLRMNPNHYDIQSGGMTRDKLADAINKLKGAL